MAIKPFLKAVVKWNGGAGALLCNGCRTIIAYGFNHEDKEHFCALCRTTPYAQTTDKHNPTCECGECWQAMEGGSAV